jgi:hypothetical protein
MAIDLGRLLKQIAKAAAIISTAVGALLAALEAAKDS